MMAREWRSGEGDVSTTRSYREMARRSIAAPVARPTAPALVGGGQRRHHSVVVLREHEPISQHARPVATPASASATAPTSRSRRPLDRLDSRTMLRFRPAAQHPAVGEDRVHVRGRHVQHGPQRHLQCRSAASRLEVRPQPLDLGAAKPAAAATPRPAPRASAGASRRVARRWQALRGRGSDRGDGDRCGELIDRDGLVRQRRTDDCGFNGLDHLRPPVRASLQPRISAFGIRPRISNHRPDRPHGQSSSPWTMPRSSVSMKAG